MSKSPLSRPLVAAAALLAAGGCADVEPQAGGLSLHFAALSAGGCQETNNGRNVIPDDVDALTVAIAIDGLPTRYERTTRAAVNAASQWLLPNISANVPVDVHVYGCKSGAAVWAGSSLGLQVEEQKESQAHVFLAPVDKLGCTGSEAISASAGESDHLSRARSMAAVATLPGGDAVVVGGIGSYAASGDGVAARDVDRYDHRGGHFRKGPQLLEARVWHHAFGLDDRHVLVVGGATGVSRFGDTGLPTSLLMPKNAAAARPAQAAELLDLQAGTATASTAAVGTGARLLSSSIATPEGLLFVGGVDDAGDAVQGVTLLSDLAGIAAGGAGTATNAKLVVARARPALLTLHDGSVLVWGGNAGDKATELGERRKADGSFQMLAISGDAALLASADIVSVAPQAVSLGASGGVETVLVFGGARGELSTAKIPAYAVRIDVASGSATLVALSLPSGVALSAGIAGLAAPHGDNAALVSGGLVALSGGAPCAASDAECILADVLRVHVSGDASASPLSLTVETIGTFGGPRFGVATARIDAGVLLVGGQSSVVDSQAAGDAVLDPTGRVVAAPPPAAELATICK